MTKLYGLTSQWNKESHVNDFILRLNVCDLCQLTDTRKVKICFLI